MNDQREANVRLMCVKNKIAVQDYDAPSMRRLCQIAQRAGRIEADPIDFLLNQINSLDFIRKICLSSTYGKFQ